jgi:hypothetical protein
MKLAASDEFYNVHRRLHDGLARLNPIRDLQ